MPKFPSQAELAKSKAKRLEEQEKMLAENPPPSIGRRDCFVHSRLTWVDERVLEAVKEKELGNKMIQEGNYERAKEHYDSVGLSLGFYCAIRSCVGFREYLHWKG